MKFLLPLAMLLLSSLAMASPTTSPDPLRCTGYPEQRIFLQSQGYWERSPGKNGTDYGLVSEGTCFPVGATLTGKVHFDIIVLIDNPGVLDLVEIQLFGNSGQLGSTDKAPTPNKKCPTVCQLPFSIDVDTARFKVDGLQEFRFHAEIKEPDGKHLMATTGWQAYFKNGFKVSNYRTQGISFEEARGWYDGEGYTCGRFTSPMPWQAVSGTWKISVAAVKGSGGRTVGSHLVSIDACPTCQPESDGTVINSGDGQFTGSLSIDTTKLTNGLHTVWVRASAPSPTGSTLSGTEVVPFVVQN